MKTIAISWHMFLIAAAVTIAFAPYSNHWLYTLIKNLAMGGLISLAWWEIKRLIKL